MKYLLLLAIALLPACTHVQTKKEPSSLPLSSVVPLIKQGMGVAEVEKALSVHKPALRFTQQNDTIWEIRERTSDDTTHSMNANRLVVTLDKSGKVTQSLSSFCFLPDQEPLLSDTPATRCYQKHLFPFDKQLTYNAIKRLLIISNYQVDHSDAASELISATGTHSVEGDDDKMMFIKLSIAFANIDKNATEVVMSASFSTTEKQSTWVQAGFGGVTIPVPLPFQRTEEWIDTGIVPPKFYLNFYDALTNLIAHEYLPYKPVIITAFQPDKAKRATVSPAAPKPVPADFTDAFSSTGATVKAGYAPEDDVLMKLDGPIDSAASLKGSAHDKKKPASDDAGIASSGKTVKTGAASEDDVLMNLDGPIDSAASLKGSGHDKTKPASDDARIATPGKTVKTGDVSEDDVLMHLDGPIDSESSLKVNFHDEKESDDDQSGDDVFSGLHGKPIDSDRLHK